MSRRAVIAVLVLANFVGAMLLCYATSRKQAPSVKRLTHQERLAARPGPVRFAIMDDYIRDTLIADWDKHAKDKTILERGFCIKWQYDFWADEKAYRATQIARPDTILDAKFYTVSWRCPASFKGAYTAEVHIHPPQTCADDEGRDCWSGGPYAYQCLPSDQDRRYLQFIGQPFGFVQCSREGVVAYFEETPQSLLFIPSAPPNLGP